MVAAARHLERPEWRRSNEHAEAGCIGPSIARWHRGRRDLTLDERRKALVDILLSANTCTATDADDDRLLELEIVKEVQMKHLKGKTSRKTGQGHNSREQMRTDKRTSERTRQRLHARASHRD